MEPRRAPVTIKSSTPIRRFVAFMRGITERKKIEAALERNEALFRDLVETSSDWFWEQDRDFRFTSVSFQVYPGTGVDEHAIIGRRRWDLPALNLSERDWEAHRALLKRHEPFRDFIVRRPDVDGRERWVSLNGKPVFDENGAFTGYRGTGRDITAQVLAEREVRASVARLSVIFQASPIGILVTRAEDGFVLEANDAALAIFGYPREEFVLRGVRETYVDPAQRAELVRQLQRDGRIERVEVRFYRKGGEVGTLELSARAIEFQGQGCFVALVSDITERKLSEARHGELEAQLRQVQKMDSLGTLAGGIAHEFNNVIGAILGNAAVALEDLEPGHAASERVRDIRKAGRRARDLVRQILTFSKSETVERRVIEPGPVAAEAADLLRVGLPAGVSLELQLGEGLPNVFANATQMQQVVLNLGSNAIHALKDGQGRVEVRLAAATLDAALARRHPGLRPGRYLRLTVSDTGSGIPPELRERIFEPFFTTKAVGEGTGLGLSVVQGIVESHDAAIVLDSAKGEGVRFDVYFPAAEGEIEPDPAVPAPPQAAPGHRVLYLDDDEMLVSIVELLLKRRGYQVGCYTDSVKALEALREAPEAFDVVLTDFSMPQISGLEVAQRVAGIAPGLPVVLMSGYTEETLRGKGSLEAVRRTIYKPDAVEQLIESIESVLAEEGIRRPRGS